MCVHIGRRQHQTVHYDFDVVLLVLIQRDVFREVSHLTVDAHAYIAGTPGVLENVSIFAFTPAHHRPEHQDTTFGRHRHNLVNDLLHGLASDFAAAFWAMWMPDSGVEKSQVVVDFRHRPNG